MPGISGLDGLAEADADTAAAQVGERDDERAVRDVCREVAQSLGFNTLVAESAEHAYRLLDTQSSTWSCWI